MNVLRQGYAAGVKNFVITGSSGSVLGKNENKMFTGVTIGAKGIH